MGNNGGQQGYREGQWTVGAAMEERRQHELAEARLIEEAKRAKRAMDFLAATGWVCSAGFFWDGTGSLVDAVLWRADERDAIELMKGSAR